MRAGNVIQPHAAPEGLPCAAGPSQGYRPLPSGSPSDASFSLEVSGPVRPTDCLPSFPSLASLRLWSSVCKALMAFVANEPTVPSASLCLALGAEHGPSSRPRGFSGPLGHRLHQGSAPSPSSEWLPPAVLAVDPGEGHSPCPFHGAPGTCPPPHHTLLDPFPQVLLEPPQCQTREHVPALMQPHVQSLRLIPSDLLRPRGHSLPSGPRPLSQGFLPQLPMDLVWLPLELPLFQVPFFQNMLSACKQTLIL